MAYTFTVVSSTVVGNLRKRVGTFSSESGDSLGVLGNSVHGLNFISDQRISLEPGGIATQIPKVTISSGEITFVFDDTLGKSGRWMVEGR